MEPLFKSDSMFQSRLRIFIVVYKKEKPGSDRAIVGIYFNVLIIYKIQNKWREMCWWVDPLHFNKKKNDPFDPTQST